MVASPGPEGNSLGASPTPRATTASVSGLNTVAMVRPPSAFWKHGSMVHASGSPFTYVYVACDPFCMPSHWHATVGTHSSPPHSTCSPVPDTHLVGSTPVAGLHGSPTLLVTPSALTNGMFRSSCCCLAAHGATSRAWHAMRSVQCSPPKRLLYLQVHVHPRLAVHCASPYWGSQPVWRGTQYWPAVSTCTSWHLSSVSQNVTCCMPASGWHTMLSPLGSSSSHRVQSVSWRHSTNCFSPVTSSAWSRHSMRAGRQNLSAPLLSAIWLSCTDGQDAPGARHWSPWNFTSSLPQRVAQSRSVEQGVRRLVAHGTKSPVSSAVHSSKHADGWVDVAVAVDVTRGGVVGGATCGAALGKAVVAFSVMSGALRPVKYMLAIVTAAARMYRPTKVHTRNVRETIVLFTGSK